MLRRENCSTALPTRPGETPDESKKSTAVADEKPTAVADEKPVDKPALELTARERTVFEKYREIHTNTATAATRMKLVNDADKSRLVPDHRDEFIGKLLLADALGAADLDFSDGLISQLANAGAQHNKVDVQALNFMLSVVKNIKPRDQVESMLAAQMAGIHMATMRMMAEILKSSGIPCRIRRYWDSSPWKSRLVAAFKEMTVHRAASRRANAVDLERRLSRVQDVLKAVHTHVDAVVAPAIIDTNHLHSPVLVGYARSS